MTTNYPNGIDNDTTLPPVVPQQEGPIVGPPGPAGPPGPRGVSGPPGLSTGPAGGDLSGHYPNPFIIKISGDGVNPIPVNSPLITWNASVAGPVGISQAQALTGGGTPMAVAAQPAAVGSNANGGALIFISGAGDGTGVSGNVTLGTGDTRGVLSITPTKSQFTVNGAQVLQVNAANLSWNASVAGPVGITQDQSVVAGGQLMEIVAQAAATGSNTNGGAILLASGVGDGTGVAGNAILATGDLQGALSITPTKSQFTVGGAQVLQVNPTTISWNASVAGPVGLTQDQSVTAGGQPMEIAAQSAATGSNTNGGALLLASGAGDGTGTNGNIFLVTPDFQNGLIVAPANNTVVISSSNNVMLTLGASLSIGGGLCLGNNTGGSFDLSAGGTITLAPAQFKYPYIVFNGTLPNNTTVVLPANPGSKWVIDATGVTLGGFTLTLQANSINWGTTIGTTDLYEVIFGGVAGQLYGNVLTP